MTLLCKSLLPLPDKHSGLADKGIRYRKRWLDLITNPESIERFRLRSRILLATRKYLEEAGFEEVETPVCKISTAAQKPVPSRPISMRSTRKCFCGSRLEISLKKLIVGGMQRIYEIGKVFRNEGIDRTHNPEFTMMEAYAAGWDYNDMMAFTEGLFVEIAMELFGDTKITYAPEGMEPVVIDVKAPWKRLSMKDAIKIHAHLDVDRMDEHAMRKALLEETPLDPKAVSQAPRGALIAMLFGELAEPHLIEPHHIIDHPIETTPLCKPHRDPFLRKEGLVERFESFILGKEICNAYTELNDPQLQRSLLEQQAQKRDAGDAEASPMDEEFVEAICQGMPPTGGVGIGIDRMVMLFTSAASIRDVLFFPLMRPEGD